jgi:hypothetical protein
MVWPRADPCSDDVLRDGERKALVWTAAHASANRGK